MITILFKDVIELIASDASYTTDEMGNVIEAKIKKLVYANKKSIRQTEYYQALATGLKPEIMFVIRYEEYNDEKSLSYEGKVYNIIRTYSKNNELLELVCNNIVNNGGVSDGN